MKLTQNSMRYISWLLVLLILIGTALPLAGCMSVYASDLMADIQARSVEASALTDDFCLGYTTFAVKLTAATAAETVGENLLLSPLSVLVALGMTENGAAGSTRSEMETLLCGLPADALNKQLYSYVRMLSGDGSGTCTLADSVWIRNGFKVRKAFLQTLADYYAADAYAVDFDHHTLEDMNHWISTHTDGAIQNMIDRIPENTVTYLLQTVLFEAAWQKIYEADQVREAVFSAADGSEKTVQMMHSVEETYLSDENAVGFLRPYKDDRYRFFALLPKEGMTPEAYLATLTGEKMTALLSGGETASVKAALPKFSCDMAMEMRDLLCLLGMPTAFDERADFTAMTDDPGIYINRVLHKAHIDVDTEGTAAAAATVVELTRKGCAPDTDVKYTVTLDRPFVYGVVDSASGLPIFIGIVNDLKN